MNLEVNRKGKLEKSCDYTTLLNNLWLKEELKRKTRIYLDTNENTTYQQWDATEAVLKGTFIPLTATAKSLQSCPTPCDPTDGSPPGSPVPGILQARTLEWAAISFSNAWKVKSESEVTQSCQVLATPWTAAYQAPPSMGFSRQEYWSGVPLTSPIPLNTYIMKRKIISNKWPSNTHQGTKRWRANKTQA